MLISVLASGSKANCSFIAHGKTAILVDCGLSLRETEKRLYAQGIDPSVIQGILITHEHRDHIYGLQNILKKYPIKVYLNELTMQACTCLKDLPKERIFNFETGANFELGDLQCRSFSISHDAADPVGFRFSTQNRTLAVATDLGFVSNLVRENLREADALILESNYDFQLLHDAPYPWELKQRISGRSGHLSNEDAVNLLVELLSTNQKVPQLLVAGHISENSNTSELALSNFKAAWKQVYQEKKLEVDFVAGSPYFSSRMFNLEEGPGYKNKSAFQVEQQVANL